MSTIIQKYGPIYGESVNGTVQGRPNGSVYVPLSNTIEIKAGDGLTIAKTSVSHPNRIYVSALVNIVAVAQDLASNITTAIYSDAECTTMMDTVVTSPAGQFNIQKSHVGNATTEIVPGTTYYLRAILNNNGNPIAYSNIVEVTGA